MSIFDGLSFIYFFVPNQLFLQYTAMLCYLASGLVALGLEFDLCPPEAPWPYQNSLATTSFIEPLIYFEQGRIPLPVLLAEQLLRSQNWDKVFLFALVHV